MIFSSLEFLTLFLPLFLAAYSLTPPRLRNRTLLLFSWLFYGWWSPLFLLLFIGLTFFSWCSGLLIGSASGSRRRWLLAASIFGNATTLFWYKYANILIESYNELAWLSGSIPLHWQRVILPIGLSFIILQAISYLVDVYRAEVRPQTNFFDFAAYLAMFGQLIAGPILRYEWVQAELMQRSYSWANFSAGARRFMIGMCMKVLIADTLSPLVDVAFSVSNPTFMDVWLGCWAYSLQLFFDFAGYSAMAIGLGRMLGFHFPENFNHPYLADSIQDFWRRWHISLSTWIRDYLYIPLGGNRLGTVRTYINLIMTMAIAGMWHGGESWNFLLWGLAHGFALSVARAWKSNGLVAVPRLFSRVATLLFVCMAWVIFRAPDFDSAMSMYAGQLGLQGWAFGESVRVALQPSHVIAAFLGVFCIVAPVLKESRFMGVLPLQSVMATFWPIFGFVLSFSLIASRDAVPFLYFQF